MLENLKQLIGLAWPIASGVVLIIVGIFFVEASSSDPTQVIVDLGGTEIPVPIKNRVAAQGGILLTGLSTIAFAFIRDYTSFIPTDVRIKIFYDDEGIAETLAGFSAKESANFNAESEWKSLKADYLNGLNKVTADILQSPFRFNAEETVCHSEGAVRFRMKKIGSRQVYEILECDAELTHVYDPPGGTRVEIASSSVLLPSTSNKVKLSFRDMFINRYVIIEPEVKQTARTAAQVLYHHSLAAITRLKIFPYVEVGRTLFMAKNPDGKRFPVAYADYTY